MSREILGGFVRPVCTVAAAAGVLGLIVSCAKIEIAPHLRPISNDSMMLLGKRGMNPQAPMFIRVYKEESELEVWKLRDDGRYYHFKTYPICNWSGELGPKLKHGDRQAPEGFYTVNREQMNPDSNYHLAFNLGFPNPYDKAHRRTGDALMVHGKCKSAGCYAMTDALMEEIYALARESFIGGQEVIHVHAFPFRMTPANMARHAKSEWQPFWRTLKEGYDYFELTRQVPTVAICNRRYVVNVSWRAGDPSKLNPEAACPTFQRPAPSPFSPKPGEQLAENVVVPGPKMRETASYDAGQAQRSGLTTTPEAPVAAWWKRVVPNLIPSFLRSPEK